MSTFRRKNTARSVTLAAAEVLLVLCISNAMDAFCSADGRVRMGAIGWRGKTPALTVDGSGPPSSKVGFDDVLCQSDFQSRRRVEFAKDPHQTPTSILALWLRGAPLSQFGQRSAAKGDQASIGTANQRTRLNVLLTRELSRRFETRFKRQRETQVGIQGRSEQRLRGLAPRQVVFPWTAAVIVSWRLTPLFFFLFFWGGGGKPPPGGAKGGPGGPGGKFRLQKRRAGDFG